MDIALLKPGEVDLLFRYPNGRSVRLAKKGLLPHVRLPDGEVRFRESEIQAILQSSNPPISPKECIV